MTTFTDLRTALIARQKEWVADSGQEPDVGFRAIEFVGEVGELFNVIKKILREAGGWRGTRATQEDLADEFGDALICLYNLAEKMGVDLDAAAIAKFNKTSEKYGFPHRIEAGAEDDGIADISTVRMVVDVGGMAELETELARVRRILEFHNSQLVRAMVSALEFYGDISKYPAPLTGGMGELWSDCGERAREALVAVVSMNIGTGG